MANEEHLKIIKQGVKAWNAWRGNTFRDAPNLSGADLRYAHLNHADLRGADLIYTNLSGADIREADLSEANLVGADLRSAFLGATKLRAANLSKAKLSKASLGGADLSGANLCGANLSEANLNEANLSTADLSGAELRLAFLGSADLSHADLSGAELRSAFLGSANLSHTDLSRASIGWTTFASNDLSTVRGLETVVHRAPSTIGVDTLYLTDGKIPEVFLRGAGLPEGFIAYVPSLIARPIEFYSCFISYNHTDRSFARRLYDTLQGRGIRCWLDEHELLPGDKIYTEVDRGIRLWDKVLLCCSKDALTSWWVDNEIKISFDKEQQLWRERGKEVLALIPLSLDDYLFSGHWKSGLATEVKARLAAHFNGWEHDNKKFEEQFERLVKALRTDGGGKRPPPPTVL